jgi:hypothetical protein
MIDKISGQVAYAVMSFGGFMGVSRDCYSLLWNVSNYNPALEGYEVNFSEEQLKGAPKYSTYETWDWENQAQSGAGKCRPRLLARSVLKERRRPRLGAPQSTNERSRLREQPLTSDNQT